MGLVFWYSYHQMSQPSKIKSTDNFSGYKLSPGEKINTFSVGTFLVEFSISVDSFAMAEEEGGGGGEFTAKFLQTIQNVVNFKGQIVQKKEKSTCCFKILY